MSKPLILASWMAFLLHFSAGAVSTDDLCTLRPDMCDEGARHRAANAQTAKANKPAVRTKKCRPADHFSLKEMDLPVCGNSAPTSGRSPAAESPPAATKSISYSDYMNSNMNSGISGNLDKHQDAFPEPPRGGILPSANVVSMPVEGAPTDVKPPSAPTTNPPAAYPSATPPTTVDPTAVLPRANN